VPFARGDHDGRPQAAAPPGDPGRLLAAMIAKTFFLT